MKKLFIIISFILISIGLNSQTKTDILYLNNGTVIKGFIFEKSDDNIKIKTANNTIHILRLTDIKKIENEEVFAYNDSIQLPAANTIYQETIVDKTTEINTSIKRRGYVGSSFGIFTPINMPYSNTGLNVDVINIGYVFKRYIGISGRVNSNYYKVLEREYCCWRHYELKEYTYTSLSMFTGLLVTIPIAHQAANIDFKPMLGIYDDWGGDILLAWNFGVSVRFNLTKNINILVNSDIILSDHDKKMAKFKTKLLSVNLGVAYRLK